MEDQSGAAGFDPAVPAPPVHTDRPEAPRPASPQASEALHPWLSIWTRPRQTMRWVLASDPRRHTIILAALGGIGAGIGSGRSMGVWDQIPAPLLLLVLSGAGALAGVAGLYIEGLLLRLTSGWLEGRGTLVATRAALAWSNVPAIWGLLLWVPLIAAFGFDGFTLEPSDLEGNPAGLALIVLAGLGEMVIGAWGFVIFLNCLAEAQGFSAWRALGASLLALLLTAAPFALALIALHGS